MKKLWLSAFAAACLLAGTAAQAGDHGRDRYRDDWDGHREHRHHHHDRYYGRPVVVVPRFVVPRPVYYERPAYYGRPVYYERPAYYGRPYDRDGDGEIHGSISVGF